MRLVVALSAKLLVELVEQQAKAGSNRLSNKARARRCRILHSRIARGRCCLSAGRGRLNPSPCNRAWHISLKLAAAGPCLCSVASNAALDQAGQSRVQWQHSYVADGKTFCGEADRWGCVLARASFAMPPV